MNEMEQREGFNAWLAMMDYELEMYALDDVPQLADVAGTSDSFPVVEHALLSRFTTIGETRRDEASRQFFDRTVRYVGTTLAQLYDGRWELFDRTENPAQPRFIPMLRFPYRELPLHPLGLVTSAIARRRGTGWADVRRYLEQDRERFQATGSVF